MYGLPNQSDTINTRLSYRKYTKIYLFISLLDTSIFYYCAWAFSHWIFFVCPTTIRSLKDWHLKRFSTAWVRTDHESWHPPSWLGESRFNAHKLILKPRIFIRTTRSFCNWIVNYLKTDLYRSIKILNRNFKYMFCYLN